MSFQLRYGEVPEAFASRVQTASQDQIDTWLPRILSAETIEGVFAEEEPPPRPDGPPLHVGEE